MTILPTGTVTFLFTDVEGSTRLIQRLGDAHSEPVFAGYRRLLLEAVQTAGGYLWEDQGESFLFVFQRARDGVHGAVAAQRALATHAWPEGAMLRVRMGMHTGEPVSTGGGYVGVDVHRVARICQAGHGGQILLSEPTRVLIEDGMREEVTLRDLGEHRLKDLTQPQRLFQVVAEGLRVDFPPLNSLDVLANNLPVQLTSFIGREREKADVRRLLSTTRLLTLTGAGGAGKTRLALQAAAEALEEFRDGVWVVELASLADATLVPKAVASAMSVPEQPGRALSETLVDYLRSKSMLLVLDNCEHLLLACANLADTLLRACPHLRILTTSREAMGIEGENHYRVPSLSLPDAPTLPLERLNEFEAVRLFTDRATAALPSFAVTTQNAKAVATICQQLDGIPLAIELAAPRVKALPVEHIAERLHDRFRLLTSGRRTALPRHQTLRAAMDWSYDLLSEPERVLLRRLSVFVGGFTLEAAEAVCQGQDLNAGEVVNLLTHLVEKSLVIFQEREGRYGLLETVRQYGWDKLPEAGEEADVRRRHRDWYLALAEQADPELRGPRQRVWLDRLEAELYNLRAALEWSRTQDDRAEAGLRLAAALWRFWDMRTYLTEGRGWLDGMLARPDGVEPGLRARALNVAGVLAHRQGDYDGVSRLSGEALRLARQEHDDWNSALALHHLAHAAQSHGDLSQAAAMMDESIELFRKVDNRWGMALSMNCRGDIARNQADDERAAVIFGEALAMWRAVGDRWGLAASLQNLGWVMQHRGDSHRAATLFEESLAISRELGLKAWVILILSGLARSTAADVHPERAATLLGAVDGLLSAMGARMEASERPDFERTVETVRARLGAERFAAASAEGQAMTLEQAIEYALSGEA